MSIAAAVSARGIAEVLHFTTNVGLTGVLATKKVLSRTRLPAESYLEHIYKPNCADRSWDIEWHDYVNLSISEINSRLFGICKNKWYAAIRGWWCILSFESDILTHPGVFFATTNNRYSGVRQTDGIAGLEALFADRVHQYDRRYAIRTKLHRACDPTCFQAEALYPAELSTTHLRRIYFRDADHAAEAEGIIAATDHAPVPCVVAPERFKTSG